jgi:hypothetical protein
VFNDFTWRGRGGRMTALGETHRSAAGVQLRAG